MGFVNQVLVIALSLSILLNLLTGRLSSLFLSTIFVASVALLFGITRFLQTAYIAFHILKNTIQFIVAFVNAEFVKDALQQLRVHAIKIIESGVKTVHEIYDEVIIPLANRVCAGWKHLWRLLRPVLVDCKLLPADTGDVPEEVYSKEYQKRALLLISLPSGRSYEAMKEALSSDEPKPSAPFINWNGNDKSVIPALESLETSIRHFAICIIALGDWDDPTKSLLQKFASGTFWELMGPGMIAKEGEGVSWHVDRIRLIDSVVEVGVVQWSNQLVSERFYQPLRAAWPVYEAVWWNSYDFAVRLAYTLVDARGRHSLCKIRRQIETKRSGEAMAAVLRYHKKIDSAAGAGFNMSFCGGFVSSVLFPPAFLLAFGAAVASLTVGIGNQTYAQGLQSRKEPGYMDKWRRCSKVLEQAMPALQGFADGQSKSAKAPST